MILNGKQKRYLRSLAVTQRADYQVGKDGLTFNLISGIKDDLRVHELVKVSLLKSCEEDLREVALEASAQLGAELVQTIGHTFILYKPNKDLGEKRIVLP